MLQQTGRKKSGGWMKEEKHMDFFSKLGDAITETGRDVSQKVSEMTGIAKLNMEIRSKEDFVQKQYTQIGKQYYEMHKEDQEPFFEEMKLITETLKDIDQLKVEVAGLKGKKCCPSCGAVNESEAVYCIKCGVKCESIFEEEEVEEAEYEEVKEEIVVEELEKEPQEGMEEGPVE